MQVWACRGNSPQAGQDKLVFFYSRAGSAVAAIGLHYLSSVVLLYSSNSKGYDTIHVSSWWDSKCAFKVVFDFETFDAHNTLNSPCDKSAYLSIGSE